MKKYAKSRRANAPQGPLPPSRRATPASARPRKARRRIQRAFLTWLHENRARFLTAPPRVVKRTDQSVDLSLPGLNPVMGISLGRPLVVTVEWQGWFWDLLGDFDVSLHRVPGGYQNWWGPPESERIYPSREALWIACQFEPFLEWVNTVLFPARWLALYGEGHSTSAWLVAEPDPRAGVTVPVWVERPANLWRFV